MWFGVHGPSHSETPAPGCESPISRGGRVSLSLQVETTLPEATGSLINTKPTALLEARFPLPTLSTERSSPKPPGISEKVWGHLG